MKEEKKLAIRQIRQAGDEILRKKARTVEVFDEKLKELAKDMIETMHKNNGVGLAGQQVGILKRIVVIDIYDNKGPIVFINPVITKTKGEHEVEEGCLSFPNQFAVLKRPKEVEVEYYDLDGKKKKLKAKDLLAQAICHETEHLDGILFIDNMLPGTLEIVKPENN